MIICPNCKNVLDEEALTCGGKHCLKPKFGVARLLRSDFADRFLDYEKKFAEIRELEGVRIKDKTVYNKMPFLNPEEGKGFREWSACRADLKIISKLISGKTGLEVLNYGSWNGWLSNQLVLKGHKVTAIAYFIDEYDGLGANRHFDTQWLSVQMDIENDLDIIEKKFDCIILNRGVSFLEHPINIVELLIRKLNLGGLLIITGMNVYRKVDKVRQTKLEFWDSFKDKYGFDIRFTKTKSYLDSKDAKK